MNAAAGSRELSMEEFLGHKTGAGSDTKYVGKWKERDGKYIDTLLHTKCGIAVVYRHGIPRLVPRKDKKTGEESIEVWSENAVCWESEEVSRRQNKRDHDGKRTHPPEVCGVCKMLEHIRTLVVTGALSWTDEVFRFSGSREDRVWHAGGIYGAFGGDELSADEKAELKAANIFQKDAWKEVWNPKASYIFRIEEFGKSEGGVQVAVEPALLGDKVKKLIRDNIESDGDEGNPLLNPYVIRWKSLPDEKEFNKKYDAIVMRKLKPSEADLAAIRETSAPDISHLMERYTAGSMMAKLKAHCLIDLPWEKFFGDVDAPEAEKPQATRAPEVSKAQKPAVQPQPDEEEVACDDCDAPMKVSDSKCTKCGKVYDVTPAEPPSPPAKVLKKRSEGVKAATPPAEAKAAPKAAPVASKKAFEEPPADEDELPF